MAINHHSTYTRKRHKRENHETLHNVECRQIRDQFALAGVRDIFHEPPQLKSWRTAQGENWGQYSVKQYSRRMTDTVPGHGGPVLTSLDN